MARARWFAVAVMLGCATTSLQESPDLLATVPRQSFHYSNQGSFMLDHRDAFPRVLAASRPHDVSDGNLSGFFCGTGVELAARWSGSTLTLQGLGDIPWPNYPHSAGPMALTIGVHELAPGRIAIAGLFGGHVYTDSASPIVDLELGADGVHGRVGERRFSLTANGEYLVGQLHEGVRNTPFAIYGRGVLATMPASDEVLAMLSLLACDDGEIFYGDAPTRGFALTQQEPPKGAIEEHDADAPTDDEAADDVAPPPDTIGRVRTIDPNDARATAKLLAEYPNQAVRVYLPIRATEEMNAMAASLVSLFRQAGWHVEQKTWRAHSCRLPKYDLSLIAQQPATPRELAIGVRLTLTKLHVYACQSANAIPDTLGILVLPPHQ